MSRYGLDEGVQQLTRAAELGLPEALVNQGFSYLIDPLDMSRDNARSSQGVLNLEEVGVPMIHSPRDKNHPFVTPGMYIWNILGPVD